MLVPFLFWYDENRIIPYTLDLSPNDTVEIASKMLQQYLLEQEIIRPAVYIYSMIDKHKIKILPYDTTIESLKCTMQLLVVDVDNTFTYSHIPVIDPRLLNGIIPYSPTCRDLTPQDQRLIFDSNIEQILSQHNLSTFLVDRKYAQIEYLDVTVADTDHGLPIYWEEIIGLSLLPPSRERNLRIVQALAAIYNLLHSNNETLAQIGSNYNRKQLNRTARNLYNDDNDNGLALLIRAIIDDSAIPINYVENLKTYTLDDMKKVISEFKPYYELLSLLILCSTTSKLQNLAQLLTSLNDNNQMFRFASYIELEKLMNGSLIKNTFAITSLCPDLAYREILHKHDNLYVALIDFINRIPHKDSEDDLGIPYFSPNSAASSNTSSSFTNYGMSPRDNLSISSKNYLDNTLVYMDAERRNHFYFDARQIHHLPLLEINVPYGYIPFWFTTKSDFDIMLPPQAWGLIDGLPLMKVIGPPVIRSINREYEIKSDLHNIRPDLRSYSHVTITFIFMVHPVGIGQ